MEKHQLKLIELGEISRRKRIKQREISERTGIAQANISKYFKGQGNPRLTTFFKIADAINTDITYI